MSNERLYQGWSTRFTSGEDKSPQGMTIANLAAPAFHERQGLQGFQTADPLSHRLTAAELELGRLGPSLDDFTLRTIQGQICEVREVASKPEHDARQVAERGVDQIELDISRIKRFDERTRTTEVLLTLG